MLDFVLSLGLTTVRRQRRSGDSTTTTSVGKEERAEGEEEEEGGEKAATSSSSTAKDLVVQFKLERYIKHRFEQNAKFNYIEVIMGN